MTLTIYTDGGSLNNPGQAAIAYTLYLDTTLLKTFSRAIGVATNNVAEYTALIEALSATKDILSQKPASNIQVFSDSQLMVNQINGLYKVKEASLRDLLMKIRLLEGELHIPITYTHVLREKNTLTDSLVKKELYGSRKADGQ
ncbi:ribonuclease HI family protein [Candidatus Roizmanbacteria bacterium]|nr:ribonuclease HI family protein [Candidatus Roizmanbacteria bacterium]